MTTGAYICRDAEANVLYIGSAGNIGARLRHHHIKPWWPLVADVEQRETATRALAYSVERELIVSLDPIHNRMGKGGAKMRTTTSGPVVKPRLEALAVLIESHGSVANLAKAVGVDHITMSEAWRGVAYPSSKLIARLLTVTGMQFDDLFCVENVGGSDNAEDWRERRAPRKASA